MKCFERIEVSCQPLHWLINYDTWLHHCFFQVYDQWLQFSICNLCSRENCRDFRNIFLPFVFLSLKFVDYYYRPMIMLFLRAFNAVIFLVFGILAFLFRFETYKYDLKIFSAIAFFHLFEHESLWSALHCFILFLLNFSNRFINIALIFTHSLL